MNPTVDRDPARPAVMVRNERIQDYLDQHGISIRQFAHLTGTVPATAEGWAKDRNAGPTRPGLARLARTAGMSVAEAMNLFPKFDATPRPDGQTHLAGWPRQDAIPAHAWTRLLDTATHTLWVLDYAPTLLLTAVPDLPDRLAHLATNNADVRVLLAGEDADATRSLGRHTLDVAQARHDARHALAKLRPALPTDDHLLAFDAPLPATLIRADDTWWTPTPIYRARPAAWPVISFTTTSQPDLAAAHTTAFEAIWAFTRPPRTTP